MSEHLLSTTGLSFERLRAFLEIANARGISRAARGNPNRQSQLSRQLAELEAFFGKPLINRGRRIPFSLTEAGSRLKAIASQHLTALNDLKRATASQPVMIRIGSGESLLSWLVVPAIATLQQSANGIRFALHNRRSSEVIAAVTEGALELGIVRRDTPTEGLQCVPLGSIASVLVTPAKLARRPRAEIPIAIMDKAAVRDADSPSAEAAATERATFFCTSYIQMRELVLRGCCSAVLPRFLVTSDMKPSRFMMTSVRGRENTAKLMLVKNESFLTLHPYMARHIDKLFDALRKHMGTDALAA